MIAICSADNRDYCDYMHVLPDKPRSYHQASSIREVTLKSFSMSVHIKRPGFQLLSLVDPAILANPDMSSYADTACFLPDQYRIYNVFYTPLLCVTLFILFMLNLRARMRGSRGTKPSNLSLTPSPGSSGQNSPNLLHHSDPAQWTSTWSPFSPVSFPNQTSTSPRGKLPAYLRTPQAQSTQHLVASSRPSTPGPSSPSTLGVPMGGGLPFSDRNLGGAGMDDDEDEDDTMYPAQYALRTSESQSRAVSSDGSRSPGWAHVRTTSTSRHPNHQNQTHRRGDSEEEDYDMVRDQEMGSFEFSGTSSPRVQNEFISAPGVGQSSSSSSAGLLSGGSSSRARKWSRSYTFVFRGRRRRITLGLPTSKSLQNLLQLFGFGLESPSLGLRRNRGGSVMMFVVDMLSVFWPSVVVWVIINWTVL